jgi:hypothetical protein
MGRDIVKGCREFASGPKHLASVAQMIRFAQDTSAPVRQDVAA